MERNAIQNLATEETYQDDQVIFKEGSSGDWIYIVISGAVEISKEVGGEKKIIEVLSSGEVFGELGFIGNIKRTATARAVGLTTLGIIDREFLDNEFNKLSGQFRLILIAVTHRFKKMLERVSDFTSRGEPRITRTLSLTYKDRKAFIQAYTGDVSAGGLNIRTEKPLPKGYVFNLKLQIPAREEPIPIKAEVAWVKEKDPDAPEKPGSMGVKFCEISEKDYQFLKEYVSLPP